MREELIGLPACEPNGRNWFWHGEQVLALLEEHRPKVCVELGTWKGGSAIAVARLVRQWNGGVWCFDVWNGAVSIEECHKNVRDAGQADVIKLYKFDSVVAAKAWHPRAQIDYLYVDADHSIEGCYNDLVAWWPHLKVGGLIAGDDYDDPRWGVTAAWDRFEAEHDQVFERRATPGSDPACTRLIWGVKR